ncbi:MAG: hypothetical protein WBM35_11790 [Candidatus Electrothrix sp.]
MRSAKKVRLQSTIFHLIGRLITSCRFFSFIQKNLQTDWFGAESRSLIAGRLMATGYACVYVLSVQWDQLPFLRLVPPFLSRPVNHCIVQMYPLQNPG